jgi:hypothetical protein
MTFCRVRGNEGFKTLSSEASTLCGDSMQRIAWARLESGDTTKGPKQSCAHFLTIMTERSIETFK